MPDNEYKRIRKFYTGTDETITANYYDVTNFSASLTDEYDNLIQDIPNASITIESTGIYSYKITIPRNLDKVLLYENYINADGLQRSDLTEIFPTKIQSIIDNIDNTSVQGNFT